MKKIKIEIKNLFIRNLITETAKLNKGNGLLGNEVFTFSQNTDLIAYNCDISGYPRLSADKQKIVRSALLHHKKVIDYDSFVKEIESIIESQIDPKKASILFRLHVDSETANYISENLNISDKLKIISIDELLSTLKRSHNVVTQMKNKEHFWDYIEDGIWCELSNYNINFSLASNTAVNKIETARSLLNYFLDRKRVHYQSEPQPMVEIPPSKYFFEIYTGEVVWWKYSIGNYKYIDKSIDPNVSKEIIKECNKVYSIKDNKLKENIISSIFLLNEAMGCSRYDQMFIILWTIVDVLIPQIDCNERLLPNIFKNGREKQKLIIKMLHSKRNILVHQGDSSFINEDSVNQLKLIIDALIYFCISVSEIAQNTEDVISLLFKLKSKKNIDKEISIISLAEKYYNQENSTS